MTTQSRPYKPSTFPPILIHGMVTGLVLIFIAVGVITGYLFYQGVKSVSKEVIARMSLPNSMPQSVELSLPLTALPLSEEGSSLPIITIPLPVRGGDTRATGMTGVDLPDYEKKERVNILLMGIDQRPDETLARTDTLMVVTVDPNTGTAAMLSLPRDLYVPIPGYEGEDRINKAYYLGEKDDYPGGGPALAMKTIQNNFGIPIHFYAQVDFDGFRQIVDTLGGIEIDAPYDIDDPTYPDENYGYDPFYIEAGHHTLNGHDALRYARTRHTAGSDFSRAQRQQQVLLAIRDKALELGMITKIPELWATFSDSIDTNLQLIDIIELAQLANDLEAGSIRNEVLDYDYTVDYVTDIGAQVLLPLREKIQVLLNDIFQETEPTGPSKAEVEAKLNAHNQARAEAIQQAVAEQEEVKTRLAEEGAILVVQNGTDIANLSSSAANHLSQQGFQVTQFGPADSTDYDHTVLVVYDESNLYTLQMLASIFNVQEENIRRSSNAQSEVAVRIIVGRDFEMPEVASTLSKAD